MAKFDRIFADILKILHQNHFEKMYEYVEFSNDISEKQG
jgi:hypothetical protein